MLINRIIGAFTFRKGVYAEVEADASFTRTAWLLVAVIAFLNQLGSRATINLPYWLLNSLMGTVFAVIAFAVGALVINWVGRIVFKAEVNFNELVRTLGLAYVWQVIGVIGVLGAFSDALSCILAPALVIAAIALIISWFIAAKEALDLAWGQTIITVILGGLALFAITVLAVMLLEVIGMGAAAAGDLIGA